jgi:8-oxo-dGTP pyrophosphatase MutT (NUDIX family)
MRRPPVLQVAALCLRDGPDGPEVLLVRSLDSNSWILPKGWPMRGRSLAQAAEIEAWEEAGVRGKLNPTSIGVFRTFKRKNGVRFECDIHVFALRVTSQAEDYPEASQRRRKWMRLTKAIDRLDQQELTSVIRQYLDDTANFQ